MYSDADLQGAVAAGALSPQDAQRFRDYMATTAGTAAVDEEHFRLLTGFNDIFVGIAAMILLVAVGWIGNSLGLNLGDDGPSPLSGVLVAATAWGLAEFFTRKRRMALPSILLLLAFIGGVFTAAAAGMALAVGEATLQDNERAGALIGSAAAAIAAVGAWLHWKRFRVPITIAAGVAALVGVALGLIAYMVGSANEEALRTVLLSFALLLGISVFLFAMWWDSSDPKRLTRRSDVAFWLHLLAAPLIVHPIFSLLGLTDGTASVGQAVIVLLVYVIMGLTALAIDRRALLVSALAYVLWALSDLFERFGAVELSFALTALVIGSALLLLSAFWHTARRAVVKPLPAGIQAKLPVTDRAVTPQPAS